MVKRSTGVARTVWVAKSECCQKQYYSNIGFLTWLKLLPLALCVNKFSHINIVDFFITRSITSNKFVLSSLNQEIRLLAILTSLKLLPLALCVNKFTHTRLLAIFNGAF